MHLGVALIFTRRELKPLGDLRLFDEEIAIGEVARVGGANEA